MGAVGQVVVGHDVTVYNLYNYGYDGVPGDGASVNLRGRWKNIKVQLEGEWEDVTASDATLKERRFLCNDWNATLTNQQRIASSGASAAMSLALQNEGQLVHALFTEAATGLTMEIWGGVKTTDWERDRGEATDSLAVICVGGIGPGGLSIRYV